MVSANNTAEPRSAMSTERNEQLIKLDFEVFVEGFAWFKS